MTNDLQTKLYCVTQELSSSSSGLPPYIVRVADDCIVVRPSEREDDSSVLESRNVFAELYSRHFSNNHMSPIAQINDARDFIPVLLRARRAGLKLALHLAEVGDSNGGC